MNEILEKCPLFIGLKIDEIEDLLSQIFYQLKSYQPEEMVVFNEDEVKNMLIIVEGSVKGEMTDFSGKTIKIEDIEAPRPLAPAFVFGKNNKYPVDIVANQTTKILVVPKDSFLKLLQKSEIILKNYLNNISNRAQFLSSKIRLLSFQTIKGKIADYLLQIRKESNSNEFELTKSHTELAEIFGVARPSLTRAFRELDSERIIRAHGKNILILNIKKLAEYLR